MITPLRKECWWLLTYLANGALVGIYALLLEINLFPLIPCLIAYWITKGCTWVSAWINKKGTKVSELPDHELIGSAAMKYAKEVHCTDLVINIEVHQ